MTDKTDSNEREALRSIGEEQAFEAWFKVDCPVEGANAKIAAKAAWKARASLAANAGSEPVDGIYRLSPPASAHDTITEVIKELRTYNPQADEHGGKFIHKGWANQLEAVAPPQISESDAAYWVRNRALILRAIEERGFRLVSSGGLFWLSGPSHPSPPEGMVGGWISVDERLPPPFEEVVVYPRPDDYCCEAFCDTAGNWKWAEYEHNFGVHHRACHVEYWLMLPEVPAPPTSSADSRKGE